MKLKTNHKNNLKKNTKKKKIKKDLKKKKLKEDIENNDDLYFEENIDNFIIKVDEDKNDDELNEKEENVNPSF